MEESPAKRSNQGNQEAVEMATGFQPLNLDEEDENTILQEAQPSNDELNIENKIEQSE